MHLKVTYIGVNRPDVGGTCPALTADVPLSRFHSSVRVPPLKRSSLTLTADEQTVYR